jgi:hypothetical protein
MLICTARWLEPSSAIAVRLPVKSRGKMMSKAVLLAVVVFAVIVGGIGWYLTRDGIEMDQEPGQTAPQRLQQAN